MRKERGSKFLNDGFKTYLVNLSVGPISYNFDELKYSRRFLKSQKTLKYSENVEKRMEYR